MKKIKMAVALALLGLSVLAARAQTNRYVVFEYMHIPETGSEEDYVAVEKLWQRLHQRAVDAGICKAWYLERVENGGRGHYVTIRIYDSLDKIANPWPDSVTKDLYNADELKIMNTTGKVRDLIRSELWQIEASAVPDVGGDPATYVSVEFMKSKPGKSQEYAQMEKDTYLKVHQARIKAGQMKNWHFASRLFPSGADCESDYMTINVYPSKEAMRWDPKLLETALGKDQAAKLGDPTEIRTMVRGEIWHPVLGTKRKM